MKKLSFVFILVLLSLVLAQTESLHGAQPKKNIKSTKQSVVANTSKAAVYVFPVDTKKQEFQPVERVLTGIFTDKQQQEALEIKKAEAERKSEIVAQEIPERSLNANTIAWITPLGIYYHDPHNDCTETEDKKWAENQKEIVGLAPCPDCFKSKNMIPTFIKKAFGNENIADANELMTDSKFAAWAKESRLVKDINFISGTKVLAYPIHDMTPRGMFDMAKEIQAAYLKHSWRVIEVQVKNSTDDVQFVSSFSDNEALLGGVKENETEIATKGSGIKDKQKEQINANSRKQGGNQKGSKVNNKKTGSTPKKATPPKNTKNKTTKKKGKK